MFHTFSQVDTPSSVLEFITYFIAPYAEVIGLLLTLAVGFIVLGWLLDLRK